MRVIETPGHAQSHLSFWDEKNRQMIVGDVLLKHISSNPLLEPPKNQGDARPKPLLEYRNSLENCWTMMSINFFRGTESRFVNIKS